MSQLTVSEGNLTGPDFSVSLSRFRRIMILALGKASPRMLKAAIEILRGCEIYGILVAPVQQRSGHVDNRFEVFHTGHPLPDYAGAKASQRVIQAVSSMGKDELLLCLISGGTSALLPAPSDGVLIQDKRRITNLLLKSKATIHEINIVRKHISKLKGGGLVQICPTSRILSLIISDVPGNSLTDIGSGLTAEDPTTYNDAVAMLKSVRLWNATPPRIKEHLMRGIGGELPETPKPGDKSFAGVRNVIIADNATACLAVKGALEDQGVRTIVLSSCAEMESSKMAKLLASKAFESQSDPVRSEAVIIGGETSVEVHGKGVGGRNQQTALLAANTIAGLNGVVIAALGTDGVDGNSLAAGAIVDGESISRAHRKGLDPRRFLAKNDSYTFFRRLGDNLITGPTGTNVGDLYLKISLKEPISQ
jgi:glycerate-2-kinase